jgi:glucose/mannose-6-phosphate isomerase
VSQTDASPLRVDSEGMWAATAALPTQLGAALASAQRTGGLPESAISNVVVTGMGGSGIGGDLLAAVCAPELAVPVTVAKGYELPAFVGPDSLVFCVSFSGDTEETLAAADQAAEAGAAVVAVTTGGALGRLADAHGWPTVAVPSSIPQPRAALAALAAPPLVVLERVGLCDGVTARLSAAADHVARRRDAFVGVSAEPVTVARRIGRTIPLVYGSPGVAGVAAQRWKTQVNENAKAPAFWSVQPELGHNELAGWGEGGDVTRQVLTLVTLRHDAEHPQIARRFAHVEEVLTEVVADVVEVRAQATEPLACFFELALLGDLVSLHLASNEGVDPGPVPALVELKAQLAST